MTAADGHFSLIEGLVEMRGLGLRIWKSVGSQVGFEVVSCLAWLRHCG